MYFLEDTTWSLIPFFKKRTAVGLELFVCSHLEQINVFSGLSRSTYESLLEFCF